MIAWSSHIDYENLNVSRLSWRPSLKVVAVRSHILPSLGAMQAARRMAMLFPGQGGQCSGMALHLQGYPSAMRVIREAESILDLPLNDLMCHGTEEELQATEITQPCLLTHSIATWSVLRESKLFQHGFPANVVCVMGHSLGEYSATVAAGALSFPDALRIVRQRGLAMAKATEGKETSMMALMPAKENEIETLLEEADFNPEEICSIASVNANNQVVISGTKAGVATAVALAKARLNVRRAIPLKVSAPFHCNLMSPAAEVVRDLLNRCEISHSSVPIVSNAWATPVTDAADIKKALVAQICSAVKWNSSIEYARQTYSPNIWIEVGSGVTLSSLLQKSGQLQEGDIVRDTSSAEALSEFATI